MRIGYMITFLRSGWLRVISVIFSIFYIDFLSYREYGSAMTGLTYRAIDYGPVPEKWDKIYSEFPEVMQEIRQCGDFEGSVLVANGEVDTSVLSIKELDVIDKVCHALGNMSSRELTQLSHQERGWIENEGKHDRIPLIMLLN